MPANPPRAPGELAEIEALIDELIRTSESAATAYLLGSTGDEHEANEEQKRARAALVASLRSATGDGGEAMREAAAAIALTDCRSDFAKQWEIYPEWDSYAIDIARAICALPTRSTKIEGAGDGN